MAASDPRFMRRAIELSQRGWPAPNPRVGCVIVREGDIVGEGWHEAAGLDHAEAMALKAAGARTKGADVYVTLEPCNHHGRTPPCSEALIKAEVGRVFAAVSDPNPKAVGGVGALNRAGIPTEVGLLVEEATAANRLFLRAHRRREPFVMLKAAITLDGYVARLDGSSKWITSERAREEAHRLRAECGCVLVGRGTVEADNPQLTARIKGVQNQPVRAVLDSEGVLKGTEQVFGDGKALWFVSEPSRDGQIKVRQTDAGLDLREVMRHLWDRGVTAVLVEGGAKVLSSFLRAGLGDELHLFVAPKLFGKGISWYSGPEVQLEAMGWVPKASNELGIDLHLTWNRTT